MVTREAGEERLRGKNEVVEGEEGNGEAKDTSDSLAAKKTHCIGHDLCLAVMRGEGGSYVPDSLAHYPQQTNA